MNPPNDWREEFDKKFTLPKNNWNLRYANPIDVKSFIAKVEENTLREAAEVARKEIVTQKPLGAQTRGWNDACDEIAHGIEQLINKGE